MQRAQTPQAARAEGVAIAREMLLGGPADGAGSADQRSAGTLQFGSGCARGAGNKRFPPRIRVPFFGETEVIHQTIYNKTLDISAQKVAYNKVKELTPLAKFEECLQRLEKIVQELEKGEVPLEKSLTLFEEGMQLSSTCRKELEQAEGKVEILLKKNGKLQAEPFEPLTEKSACPSVGSDRREARGYAMSVEWRCRTLPRSPSPL